MLIILSENLFLWLSFQNYWHKIIQNILVPVVKPPFSPSFVSMHFVTFLKCTFSILNFLWYILMIFSHLLSYQRNDRIPLLAASFWCCVSIWLRLVKEGRSERNNFNDPGRVAWTKVTAIEMVRNRFWIYFKGRTKRMFSIRYGLWRKGVINDTMIFQPSSWKNGVSISWDGKAMKQVWEERWSSVWGKVSVRLFHAPANMRSG